RRRHTRFSRDWSSDVCSSDLISVHSILDFCVGWIGVVRQQRCGGHNLPGLTIATLRDIVLQPGLLNGGVAVFRKALNRRDLLVADLRHRQHARARRCTVYMNGARTALGDATAILRSYQVEVVAENP